MQEMSDISIKNIKNLKLNHLPDAIRKNFCFRNQQNRIIANLIILTTIWIGALLDINYFSMYMIKEERKIHVVYIFVTYIWASFIYIICCYTFPKQTNLDHFNKRNKGISIINPKNFTMYCQFCKSSKHFRSSHCKECNICVSRRDHHCPAIGGCVGFHNTKLFCNLMFIVSLTCANYLTQLIHFYNRRKQLNFENFSVSFKVLIVIETVFILLFISAAIPLFIQQCSYIYNDFPFLEFMKNPLVEWYWPICSKDNTKSRYNPFNKGFLFNFYYIIGPSIFHLILPLPRLYQQHEIIENSNWDCKLYQPHVFQVHQYLKNLNTDEFNDNWNKQVLQMQPENFIQMSKDLYGNSKII